MSVKASDRLLNLKGHDLIVAKNINGYITVQYSCCYVKSNGLLEGLYGRGSTFENACEDYLNKLYGRTLVFEPFTPERKEIVIL